MAFTKTFNFKGIDCPNGYHKIMGFFSSESGKINIMVASYFDEQAYTQDPNGFLKQETLYHIPFDTESSESLSNQCENYLVTDPKSAFNGATLAPGGIGIGVVGPEVIP